MAQITARRHHRFRSSQRDSKARSGKWPDMKMSYFPPCWLGFAPVWLRKLTLRRWHGENSTRTTPEPSLSSLPALMLLESPIIYRDESMRTACSPDGLCSDGNGLELKCPFTSRDFMKFQLGGFRGHKIGLHSGCGTACG